MPSADLISSRPANRVPRVCPNGRPDRLRTRKTRSTAEGGSSAADPGVAAVRIAVSTGHIVLESDESKSVLKKAHSGETISRGDKGRNRP